ncbi:MAG: hypothetical protein E4H02_07515 [Lentisphaerales bacterium]|jgi:hypothetical protein|nr:MAG: hypothetical protein E4H02_07515 [Lentisphaerales bacterium]
MKSVNLKDWAKLPVTMPAGWRGIEVDRLFIRGKPARLVAIHGNKQAKLDGSVRQYADRCHHRIFGKTK